MTHVWKAHTGIEIHRALLRAIVMSVALLSLSASPVAAQSLIAFKDSATNRWGYRSPTGSVVIAPEYRGAGEFRHGRAPVQDEEGFAVIDSLGDLIERINLDSLTAVGEPIKMPPEPCAWRDSPEFPSRGLECYMNELGLDSTAVGGIVRFTTNRGEGRRAVRILRAPSGAVLFEQQGYEGFSRMVALPGVDSLSAAEWTRMLYPPKPVQRGCSETWRSGKLIGGAFIEQRAGC